MDYQTARAYPSVCLWRIAGSSSEVMREIIGWKMLS
jgi:alkylation response protein AidB-like acyl-CoA dehydrogenase